MRSVQVSKPKGPLEMVERDIPEPGARHVRIKVQASASAIVIPSPKKDYFQESNTQGFLAMRLQELLT